MRRGHRQRGELEGVVTTVAILDVAAGDDEMEERGARRRRGPRGPRAAAPQPDSRERHEPHDGHLPPHVRRMHRGSCSDRLRRSLRAAHGLLAVHRAAAAAAPCTRATPPPQPPCTQVTPSWQHPCIRSRGEWTAGRGIEDKVEERGATGEVRDKREKSRDQQRCVTLCLPCHRSVATLTNQSEASIQIVLSLNLK